MTPTAKPSPNISSDYSLHSTEYLRKLEHKTSARARLAGPVLRAVLTPRITAIRAELAKRAAR
jgi:hypothetical protein